MYENALCAFVFVEMLVKYRKLRLIPQEEKYKLWEMEVFNNFEGSYKNKREM